MTDTTDIKALRSKAAKECLLLTANLSVDRFALDSLADVFDDMFRLLEAERQRADAKMPEISNLCLKVWRLEEEIAALKGDQVPVAAGTSEECSPDVYTKGVSACLVDIPKEKAEVICRGISEASGVAVDWHYIGGRVHIKTMRVTAPQKPVVLPKIRDSKYWGGVEFRCDKYQLDVQAAIEDAGGIVKDGE